MCGMCDNGEKKKFNKKSFIKSIIIEKKIKNTEVYIKKYARGNYIGEGGFGKCYEIIDTENNHCSVGKIISKSEKLITFGEKQLLFAEIKLQETLHHPNIVELEHYFEDSENVYLLLEYCRNKSLKELIKKRNKLTELEVQCYAFQIIKALKYLHSRRIIHCDLKLENLLLSDKMELKIADFGLAKKLDFEGETIRRKYGTPDYMAPEMFKSKLGYSFEVDIWSLGVIIYYLIIGTLPFKGKTNEETIKNIENIGYSYKEKDIISEPAKELIEEILQIKPEKRPSLDEILQSDFFNMGVGIPPTMPLSTLDTPPDIDFIKQYMPDVGPNGIIESYTKSRNLSRSVNYNFNFINEIISNNYNGFSFYPRDNVPLTGNYFNSRGGPLNILEKWVDYYSFQYGLGYLLFNGHIGMHFKDNSKIIYKPNGNKFIYIERTPQQTDIIRTCLFSQDLSDDIDKKIILLELFKSYLLNEKNIHNITKKDSENIDENNYVYVKKWIKTKHAILFILSNKIVQVSFLDQTEMILCSEAKKVIYIDKKKRINVYSLVNAFQSTNKEMIIKLRYTKQLLANLLS